LARHGWKPGGERERERGRGRERERGEGGREGRERPMKGKSRRCISRREELMLEGGEEDLRGKRKSRKMRNEGEREERRGG